MEPNSDIQILEKHSYPKWIRLFGIFALFFYLYTTISFFIFELPQHRNLKAKITLAQHYFSNEKYEEAIELYAKIVADHPQFKTGNIRLAESHFALGNCKGDPNFYLTGLQYLKKLNEKEIKKAEIDEIESFLPFLKKNSNSQFEKA